MDRKEYLKEYKKDYRKKSKQVSIEYSSDEYLKVKELAEKLNLPVATFIREVSIATIEGKRFLDPELKNDLQGLTFLIRNIANNVNQATKHSNTLKTVVDDNSILSQLQTLDIAIQDFVKGDKEG